MSSLDKIPFLGGNTKWVLLVSTLLMTMGGTFTTLAMATTPPEAPTPPAQPPAALATTPSLTDVNTCSSHYGTCNTCVNVGGCGWDAASSVCVQGNSSGPRYGSTQSWVWTFSGCQCIQQNSCQSCTSLSWGNCGWQSHTSTCFVGTATGPTPSTNGNPYWSWSWYRSQCPLSDNCGTSYSCSGCIAKGTCGWADNSRCVSGFSTGPAVGSATTWRWAYCPSSPSDDGDASTGLIIGVSVAVVAGIVVCTVLLIRCCTYCFSSSKQQPATNTAQGASLLQGGGGTNPAAGAAAVPVTMGGALPPGVSGTAAAAGTTSGYYGTLTSDHLEPEVEPPAMDSFHDSLQ